VRKAEFGDNYSQRVVDGLNSKLDTWNLQFTALSADDVGTIKDFLDARAGHEAFNWIPPDDVSKQFTCDQYQVTPLDGGVAFNLSAVFVQEFDL